MNELRTIAEFMTTGEADIACQRLLAEGFDASLANENAARSAIGVSIHLQVPVEQAEDALDVLESLSEEAEAEGSLAAPDDVEWVVVAHLEDIAEADIVCSRLRAEGIDAWLSDDICSFMGVNEPLSSKRRLMVNVPSGNLQEAAALLREAEVGSLGDELLEEDPDQ